jgi:hypothetical protein
MRGSSVNMYVDGEELHAALCILWVLIAIMQAHWSIYTSHDAVWQVCRQYGTHREHICIQLSKNEQNSSIMHTYRALWGRVPSLTTLFKILCGKQRAIARGTTPYDSQASPHPKKKRNVLPALDTGITFPSLRSGSHIFFPLI